MLGLVCYDSDTTENVPGELDQVQVNRAITEANAAPPLSNDHVERIAAGGKRRPLLLSINNVSSRSDLNHASYSPSKQQA